MRDDISSKSVGTSSELLVIADLKQEFIPIRNSITYATRMRILLRTLNAIRKIGVEEESETGYIGPIDRLQTIHHVRWTVIDENRRMLLAVTFDSGLETYVRRIVNVAGPVLDAILCHCEDYEDHTCWRGEEGFSRWVAERQIDVDLYGTAAPHITVDDVDYLTELEGGHRNNKDIKGFDIAAAKMMVPTQAERARAAMDKEPCKTRKQALKLIRAMYGLREYFPGRGADDHVGSDLFYLQRLTEALVGDFKRKCVTCEEEANFDRELRWFDSFDTKIEPSTEKKPLPKPEDIQGGILSSYGATSHGYMLLMRFGDHERGQKFLAAQRGELTPKTSSLGVFCNLGLTYKGLKALGLGEPALRTFPKEFRDGMEARAGTLGDFGEDHPSKWSLPKHQSTGQDVFMSSVDVVVQLQAADEHKSELKHALDNWKDAAVEFGIDMLAIEEMDRHFEEGDDDSADRRHFVEHFGYRDGISQPHVKDTGSSNGRPRHKRDEIAAGELFLGYENDREDSIAKTLRAPVTEEQEAMAPLFDKGTFLVIRKLRQEVGDFRDFIEKAKDGVTPEMLASKIMGRSMDGAPLLPEKPHQNIGSDQNDFDYKHDPKGEACPFQAHIRRTNPRKPPTEKSEGAPIPRILRRGFSYGPRYSEKTTDTERGLFFMAYNASIAEQFEVIQSWINGGNSTGVFSKQNDPMMGSRSGPEKRTFKFIHDNRVHRYELPEKKFVTLQWGLYLFVPSMAALDILSGNNGALPVIRDERVKRGLRTIGGLELFEAAEMKKLGANPTPDEIKEAKIRIIGAWKTLLEDPSGADMAEEVWSAIRTPIFNGVKRTPYGVLVGDLANVRQVFQDDGSTFSTREYWARMRKSFGELYLGMDKCPVKMPSPSRSTDPRRDKDFEKDVTPGLYDKLAPLTNDWIYCITEEKAFAAAVYATRNWFKCELPKKRDPERLELKEFAADILGRLSVDWFGLPDDGSIDIGGEPGDLPNTPDDLVSASHYFFGPRPTPFVREQGEKRGKGLGLAVKKFVETTKKPPKKTLHEFLQQNDPYVGDVDLITKILVGCTNGFVAATRGSFLSVMRRWSAEGDLWRLRHALATGEWNPDGSGKDQYHIAANALRKPMIVAMQKRSRPNLLHRVAVKEMTLGNETIEAGETVVVSLQSAAEQQRGCPEILFGGNYGETTHACSGQQMALGVLLGMIAVVMEQETIEPEGMFSLSLKKERRS